MSFRRYAIIVAMALAMVPVSGSFVRADEEEDAKKIWLVDFAKAKEISAKTGKSILMEFTGSDWCPPCKALYAKVLSKDVFKNEAPEKFVLLKLDNPRDKSKQTEEEKAQYKVLSARYGITGVPTMLFVDEKGKPFAKIVGYGGQEAKAYIDTLVSKLDGRKIRDEFMAKAAKAEGVEKAKFLMKAVEKIDNDLVVGEYKDVLKQVVKLDADNEGKVKEKAETILRVQGLKKELMDIRRASMTDPEAGVKKIDTMLSEQKLSGELLQEVLYAKALLQYGAKNKDASKATLLEALDAAPDSQMAAQIRSILQRVFNEPKKEVK